jgi:Zn-dependent peptidase ImmA (M78 family)
MPGLQTNFDTAAYITSDLTEIRVDQSVYETRENRYRFSLAHELAHKILHAEVFQQLSFSTIAE